MMSGKWFTIRGIDDFERALELIGYASDDSDVIDDSRTARSMSVMILTRRPRKVLVSFPILVVIKVIQVEVQVK